MATSDADPHGVIDGDPMGVTTRLRRSIADLPADELPAALRLLGVAETEIGDLTSAAEHLGRAIDLAVTDTTDPHRRTFAAECSVSLGNVLARQGRVDEALEMLADAAGRLDGAWLARAHSNIGAIQLHRGRPVEALEAMERGIEVALRCDDVWALGSLYNNRGLILLGRGRLQDAASDFEAAENCMIERGYESRAALVAQNRAVVAARLGDLRHSMELFESTLLRQRDAGIENPSLLVDYAEMLLLAGLSSDAASMARRATVLFERSGNRMEIASAHLLLARCALADGDADAGALCDRAAECFRIVGDAGGLALAVRLRLLSAAQRGAPADVSYPELAALPEVDLAEVALLMSATTTPTGGDDSIDGLLDEARSLRHAGPLPSQLVGWCAESVWRRQHSRAAEVAHAVGAGIRLARVHAAELGSTELRGSTLRRMEVLCAIGVESMLADDDAGSALMLIDEVRTASADLVGQAPPDGPTVDLVAQHRFAAGEVEAAPPDSRQLVDAHAELDRIERQLRRRLMTVEADPVAETALVDFDDLVDLLDERALVNYQRVGTDLIAVVLVDGRITVHRCGDVRDIETDSGALADALSRAAILDTTSAGDHTIEGVADSWRRPAARLDANLLSSLTAEIGTRRLVVAADDCQRGLAWAALPTLRGRPIEITPSASYWASSRRATLGRAVLDGVGVVVIGPDVDAAGDERRVHLASGSDIEVLAGSAATVAAICRTVDGADHLVLSGHGRCASAHPMLSSVRVADGELCWYDLESVSVLPSTIVWNACQRGAASGGASPFTTAAHALRRGCNLVVAPVSTIGEAIAIELSTRLTEPSSRRDPALALARFQMSCHDEPSRWTGLGFVAIGSSGGLDEASVHHLTQQQRERQSS